MRCVVTARRLRRRLAVTYAVVAAVATGAFALGTYVVVSNSRLDDSVDNSVAQARTNLVLAGTVLEGSSAPEDVAHLLDFYSLRPGFETVARARGDVLTSRFSVRGAQISPGMQRLVRRGDLAFERVRDR